MPDINAAEISAILKQKLHDFKYDSKLIDYGIVLQLGDGVARVYGLNDAYYGELLEFNNGVLGMAMNLEEDNIGVVLLGGYSEIKEGDEVKRTGRVASIYAGDGLLGRVLDTMTNPIDGKGPIKGSLYEIPIERKAPGVIYRQPVNEPLSTGIKSIDSMIPIGKGQRELIIGDRQTGKTSLAIDTIINQKRFYNTDNPVYCIYVAIGQKGSTVATIVKNLEKYGAMDYTVVIVANASDPASIQVFAPFTGTSIGEYFRDTGRHCLIVYDDLSKQAIAYREVSLLLKRPPGREAYPGDIFYLHSRLLERSAKIIQDNSIAKQMNNLPASLRNKVKGGGSLTALPIIETQSGDVSAYIPTNVISITDGQIFLDTELFNNGIRPAINEGISVSRVGSAAQIHSMKKVSGTLKLDQSQYHDLVSFSKFGSDLDNETMEIINKGKHNVELLKQDINHPYKISDQIAIIYVGTKNIIKDIPLNMVKNFEKEFIAYINNKYPDLLNLLEKGVLDETITNILDQSAKKIASKYSNI